MLSGITFCCLHIPERTAFIKTGIVLSLNMLSLCLISRSSSYVDERWLGSHSSTAENRLTAIKPLSDYFIFKELMGCLKEAVEGVRGLTLTLGVQLFCSNRSVLKPHLLS